MSAEELRREAALADQRRLDLKYAGDVEESWEEDREASAQGMIERVDDDPRCDCGREVDWANQLCPPCRTRYIAEIEDANDW